MSKVKEISSAEILHRNFSASMFGYKKAEVEEFLEKIAAYIEELEKRLLLSTRQKSIEKEKEKAAEKPENEEPEYSPREELISKALVMAEKTKEELLKNARKEAEGIIKEAESNSKKMLAEAKKNVSDVEKEINDLEERKRVFLLKFKAEMESLLAKIKEDELFDSKRKGKKDKDQEIEESSADKKS